MAANCWLLAIFYKTFNFQETNGNIMFFIKYQYQIVGRDLQFWPFWLLTLCNKCLGLYAAWRQQMTSRSEQRADSDIQVVIHKAGPSPAGQGELIPHWQTHLCGLAIQKIFASYQYNWVGMDCIRGSKCECKTKFTRRQNAGKKWFSCSRGHSIIQYSRLPGS